MDPIRVELTDQFGPIRRLADLAKRAGPADPPCRVIGGMAMLTWKRHLHQQMTDTTRDLDLVLLGEDLPDEPTASRVVGRLHSWLRDLGAKRGGDWRTSRVARFKYEIDPEPGMAVGVEIDVLCGKLTVGKRSRRDPAWRIAAIEDALPGEPPHFYGACVPWLDLVDEWCPFVARVRGEDVEFVVPSLASMAILKLKAVDDKIAGLERGRDAEAGRLERHARHLAEALSMLDQLGQRDRLPLIRARGPAIVEAAARVERWTTGAGRSWAWLLEPVRVLRG